jgi:hypothetical protein
MVEKTKVGVEIPPINIKELNIHIKGTSSLISNKFSETSKKQMLDKQQKKAKMAKEAKDPEKCFKESLYPMGKGKYGFPASGFKKAMVSDT